MNTNALIEAHALFVLINQAVEMGRFSLARDLEEKAIALIREHMNSLPLKDIR